MGFSGRCYPSNSLFSPHNSKPQSGHEEQMHSSLYSLCISSLSRFFSSLLPNMVLPFIGNALYIFCMWLQFFGAVSTSILPASSTPNIPNSIKVYFLLMGWNGHKMIRVLSLVQYSSHEEYCTRDKTLPFGHTTSMVVDLLSDS